MASRSERPGGPRMRGDRSADHGERAPGLVLAHGHRRGPTPTHADLARLLARFHALGSCPCELATFEPLKTSESRLAKANNGSPSDRDFLRARCADLTEQFGDLQFALPMGPIHGNAHTSNLLTDHGQVVLLDFEAAAIGPGS